MNRHEREGLVAKIRQVRRTTTAPESYEGSLAGGRSTERAPDLEARVAHLEELLEGLQDSVHRESMRLAERIADLEAQVHPSAMATALSEDARRRGL